MTRTPRYDLNEIDAQTSLAADGYKYGTVDRERIDRELYRHATHHHTGIVTTVDPPLVAPNVTLSATPGALLPATRYYYRYTYINVAGDESLPSPESFIDTPAAIAAPAVPSLATAGTGGVLASGDYYYVLSAYTPDANRETLAANPAMIAAAAGSTNKNTVTFPTLPAGALGFNVYRLVPSGIGYFLLATVPMNVMSPPTHYTDDGTVPASSERTLPLANTTNSNLSVTVCLPGATPVVPPGMLWRIYRTAVAANYAVSLLTTITDASTCYLDRGVATTAGAPPIQSGWTAPDKVDLHDGAEVKGVMAPAHTIFKETIQFRVPGVLTAAESVEVWHCPYDEAFIAFVTASLGRDSTASGVDDIIDVNKWDSSLSTPAWGSIFDEDQATMPRIVVGLSQSADKIPAHRKIVKGDLLTIDVDQAGGAATPTDHDLLVQIVVWHKDSTATSIVFP